MRVLKSRKRQPKFDTYDELFNKLGYRTSKHERDRGLSVEGVRANKREIVLSLSSARSYGISWLQKALDVKLGFQRG